jgi:hypothetical protein
LTSDETAAGPTAADLDDQMVAREPTKLTDISGRRS